MKEECRVILERVYLFLDGEILSEEERIRVQCHIEECVPCFERVGLEREVHSLVSRVSAAHTCPGALKSRILRLLQQS